MRRLNLLALQVCRITYTPVDEPDQHPVPKLESLTLSHLGPFDPDGQLLDVLQERHDHNLGLKKLVVQSCRVYEVEDEVRYGELVEEVKWNDVIVVDQQSDDSESDGESPESPDPEIGRFDDDVDVCEKYCRC